MAEKTPPPPPIAIRINNLLQQGAREYSLNSRDTEQLIGQLLVSYALSLVSLGHPNSSKVQVKIKREIALCDIYFPPPIIGPHISYVLYNKAVGTLGMKDLHMPPGFRIVAGPLISTLKNINPHIIGALNYHHIPINSFSAEIQDGKIHTKFSR